MIASKRVAIALALVLSSTSVTAADEFAEFIDDVDGRASRWTLTLGGGIQHHYRILWGVDGGSDPAFALGIARSFGVKSALFLDGVFSTLDDDVMTLSAAQAKLGVRWYPAARRPQQDQIYFQGGLALIRGYRVGADADHRAGFHMAVGLEVRLTNNSPVFFEAGLTTAGRASKPDTNTPPPDRYWPEGGDVIGMPELGTSTYAVVGVRLRL